jgi:hypothetical protein
MEIQNDSGKALVSRMNYLGPPAFMNYEKNLWEDTLRRSVRGQNILGIDCHPVVYFPNEPNQPKPPQLSDGEKEIQCYRVELIPK